MVLGEFRLQAKHNLCDKQEMESVNTSTKHRPSNQNISCLLCNTFLQCPNSLVTDEPTYDLTKLNDCANLEDGIDCTIPVKVEIDEESEIVGWYDEQAICRQSGFSRTKPKPLGPELLQFVRVNFHPIVTTTNDQPGEPAPFCEVCSHQLHVLHDLWDKLLALQVAFNKMKEEITAEFRSTNIARKRKLSQSCAKGEMLSVAFDDSDEDLNVADELETEHELLETDRNSPIVDGNTRTTEDFFQSSDSMPHVERKKENILPKRNKPTEVLTSQGFTDLEKDLLLTNSIIPCTVRLNRIQITVSQTNQSSRKPPKKIKKNTYQDKTKGGPFPCEYCPKLLTTKDKRRLHTRRHTGERPYACQYCEKRFPRRQDLVQHSVTHTKIKKYACHVCDSKFSLKGALLSHLGYIHGIMENPQLCHLCSKRFVWHGQLQRHLKNAHVEPSTTKVKKEKPKIIRDGSGRSSPSRGVRFPCDGCGSNFATYTSLKLHRIRKHGIDKAGIGLSKCAKCKEEFVIEKNYNQHVITCDGGMTFSCKDCLHKFSSNTRLSKHIASVHTGKQYMCEICGRVFTDKCNLGKHISTHKGERRYQCTECDRRCTTKGGLKLHMARHAGQEPFSCEFCEDRFGRLCSKNKHLFKVHPEEYLKDKPAYCKYCWTNFSTEGELTGHIAKVHAKATCKTCNPPKVFPTIRKFQVHLLIHTGEKPFNCPHCSKSFSQQGNLKEHIRRHTGERPHICEHCGVGFFRKKELGIHIQKIHTTTLTTQLNQTTTDVGRLLGANNFTSL